MPAAGSLTRSRAAATASASNAPPAPRSLDSPISVRVVVFTGLGSLWWRVNRYWPVLKPKTTKSAAPSRSIAASVVATFSFSVVALPALGGRPPQRLGVDLGAEPDQDDFGEAELAPGHGDI